jgi:hypothetical protein
MPILVTWQALMTTAAACGKEKDPVRKAKLQEELTYLENLAKTGGTTFYPHDAPWKVR